MANDSLVYIRALQTQDLERVVRWHNDYALYQSLGGNFRFVSPSLVEQWLQAKSVPSANEVNLAICTRTDSRHVGNIYLRDIHWLNRTAEMHIVLGEMESRGKGYGEAATRLVLSYSFEDLNLWRIYLHVLEGNEPALRMYKRCGFEVEGTLREHAYKGGGHKNVIVMGILAHAWSRKTAD